MNECEKLGGHSVPCNEHHDLSGRWLCDVEREVCPHQNVRVCLECYGKVTYQLTAANKRVEEAYRAGQEAMRKMAADKAQRVRCGSLDFEDAKQRKIVMEILSIPIAAARLP